MKGIIKLVAKCITPYEAVTWLAASGTHRCNREVRESIVEKSRRKARKQIREAEEKEQREANEANIQAELQ